MHLKRIFRACFKVRNLILLIAVAAVTYVTGYFPFTFIGLAGYIYFIMQTMKDEEFNKEYSEGEKIDNISGLSSMCDELFDEVRKTVNKNIAARIKNILREKDELMDLFNKDREDFVRQKVIEQSLKLVIAYFRLVSDYSHRTEGLSSIDANEVRDRIGTYEQKLPFLRDSEAKDDIKNAIALDRELLGKIEEERAALERIGAKLVFIESSIETFKHQLITGDNAVDDISEIESIINEASALDNAIDNQKQERQKL